MANNHSPINTMIYVDPTEIREGSLLDIKYDYVVPFLEKITGADLMISTLPMPCTTPVLLEKHIQNGAFLVQRKSGGDLESSVGERMAHSLARMRETGAIQSQCILLFIGTMPTDNYWKVKAAMSKWHSRGGVVEEVDNHDKLQHWLLMKEKHLIEFQNNPIKYVIPTGITLNDFSQGLQLPIVVDDGRKTLVTLPNIGEKKANALWKEFNGNLSDILCWLSCYDGDSVTGFGNKTITAFREYMGITDPLILTLEVEEKLHQHLIQTALDLGGVVHE